MSCIGNLCAWIADAWPWMCKSTHRRCLREAVNAAQRAEFARYENALRQVEEQHAQQLRDLFRLAEVADKTLAVMQERGK